MLACLTFWAAIFLQAVDLIAAAWAHHAVHSRDSEQRSEAAAGGASCSGASGSERAGLATSRRVVIMGESFGGCLALRCGCICIEAGNWGLHNSGWKLGTAMHVSRLPSLCLTLVYFITRQPAARGAPRRMVRGVLVTPLRLPQGGCSNARPGQRPGVGQS